jgi:hypothetical protein
MTMTFCASQRRQTIMPVWCTWAQSRSIGEAVRGLALIAGVLGAEGMRRHVEFL